MRLFFYTTWPTLFPIRLYHGLGARETNGKILLPVGGGGGDDKKARFCHLSSMKLWVAYLKKKTVFYIFNYLILIIYLGL
jgi:hypothetical protein